MQEQDCHHSRIEDADHEKSNRPASSPGQMKASKAPIPIPNATKGGQRKDTLKVPRKRLDGKQTLPESREYVTVAGKKGKKGKNVMKVMKAAGMKSKTPSSETKKKQKKLQLDREEIFPPANIKRRLKQAGAYILAKDDVYVTSAQERVNGVQFMEGLELLKDAINNGSITTKTSAKNFLADFFDPGETMT